MNAFLRSILSSLLVISTLGLGSGLALADSTKVVYHIDDAANQGLKGLRNELQALHRVGHRRKLPLGTVPLTFLLVDHLPRIRDGYRGSAFVPDGIPSRLDLDFSLLLVCQLTAARRLLRLRPKNS